MRKSLATLCLLAACTPGAPKTDPVAQGCRLEREADLPMAAGTPYAVITAQLDQQSVSLLLDTGDERLTIRPSAQLSLRLPQDQLRTTVIHGTGGSITSHDAIIQSFQIGDFELPQTGAAVAEIPMAPQVDPPLAGIMGAQLMSDYEIELNFAARRVALWQRTDCDTTTPSWPVPYTAALLERSTGNLMLLDVIVNGHTVHALLDTGAHNTTIDFAAASRLGITAANLAASRTAVSRGADENDVIMHSYRLQDIAVGDLHVANFPVLVGPVKIPFADMLLGVDFFQKRDLWISYAGQKAFIR